MEDDHVLTEMKCKVLYNSTALYKTLAQHPKIVILNCFEEQEKNNVVIQEVINRSPRSKIIVIGKVKEEFKKVLSNEIDSYLPRDITFNGLKITIDQMNFSYEYGEEFDSSDIQLSYEHKNSNVFVFGVVMLTTLFVAIYVFMN